MQPILEKAKKIIAENQDMLTVFEELDRTGRFRKRSYKARVTFTVDESLFHDFRNHCRKNGYNMSAKVERFMREEIKKINSVNH